MDISAIRRIHKAKLKSPPDRLFPVMGVLGLAVIVYEFWTTAIEKHNALVTEFCTPPDLMYNKTMTWCDRAVRGDLSPALWIVSISNAAFMASLFALLSMAGIYVNLGKPFRLRGEKILQGRLAGFVLTAVFFGAIFGGVGIAKLLHAVT